MQISIRWQQLLALLTLTVGEVKTKKLVTRLSLSYRHIKVAKSIEWLQIHSQWWLTSQLINQEWRSIFTLGGWIDHKTRHVWPLFKVTRSKVTRSCNVSAATTP